MDQTGYLWTNFDGMARQQTEGSTGMSLFNTWPLALQVKLIQKY